MSFCSTFHRHENKCCIITAMLMHSSFLKKMIRKAKMSVIDAKLGGRKQDTELLKPREAGLFKSL